MPPEGPTPPISVAAIAPLLPEPYSGVRGAGRAADAPVSRPGDLHQIIISGDADLYLPLVITIS